MELLTLFGALAVGSFAFYVFWALAIIGVFVLSGLAEKEHWGVATTIFIIAFVALGASGIFNLYQYALTHPFELAKVIMLYVGVGCLWGILKWWRFCVARRSFYETEKRKFFRENGYFDKCEFTPHLRIKWSEQVERRGSNLSIPVASEHREKIINWMYLWPFSMIGTILSDFLAKLWDFIYDLLGNLYTTITNLVFKGVASDFASVEDRRLVAEEVDAAKHAEEVRRKERYKAYEGGEVSDLRWPNN